MVPVKGKGRNREANGEAAAGHERGWWQGLAALGRLACSAPKHTAAVNQEDAWDDKADQGSQPPPLPRI